jgi:serine/threonine protein kinase
VTRRLREDAVSTAFLVRDSASGSSYILREYLPQRANDKSALRSFDQAAKLLEKITSDRISKLIKHFVQDRRFYTLEGYGGSVFLADDIRGRGHLEEEEAREILMELMEVLDELHTANPPIFHGDVMPSAILRREKDRKLVLTDFGMLEDATQIVQSNGSQTLSTSHIPAYAPPERRENRLCSASDVYALGVTMLQLLTGKSPSEVYDRESQEWMWQNIKASEGAQLLLKMMLERKVGERLQTVTSVRSAIERINSGKKSFDLGQYGDAVSEWKKAYDLAKSPSLKMKIEEAEKIATGEPTCPQCGVPVEPGRKLCKICELKRIKGEIKPLVETAVIADRLLSVKEKELIVRAAEEKGVDRATTHALITELLSELGAKEEVEAPKLKVDPPVLKLEGLKKGQQYQRSLEIRNAGGDELGGRIVSSVPWLKVSPTILDPKNRKQVVTVSIDTNLLSEGFTGAGTVRLETNAGNVCVGVQVQVEQAPPTPTELKPTPAPQGKACPRCQLVNTSGARYCAKCGWDLSKTWSPPQVTTCPKCKAGNSPEGKYCVQCNWELARVWSAEEERRKSLRTRYVIAGVLALGVVVGALLWPTSLEKRIMQRLDRGQLVTPVGDSAYDWWIKLRKEEPNSRDMPEIAAKALPLLRSRGDHIFRRWHDEARATDEEWCEALRIYEWATQLDSNDNQLPARQSYSSGQIAFRQKRFDEALNSYSQALQHEQCMSLAYNGIGRVYVNKNDHANGEFYYQQAIRCEPQWCYPYLNLGGIYLQTRRYQEAESSYKQAIACAPNKPGFHFQLASLYEKLRLRCEALGEYQKAVDLTGYDPDPGFNIQRVQQKIDQLRARCN